jgi:D-3-phosphoglycerate dehydrogenase
MKKKVLLSARIHPDGMAYLNEQGCDIIVAERDDEENLVALARNVDGIIVRGMAKITRKIIEAATQCKVIGRHGVGLETIDVAAASEYNIPVVFTPGANANAVAEHTLCLAIALAKQLCVLNGKLKEQGDYQCRLNVSCSEISGKTAGIVGLGQIGTRVAEIFQKGFGMTIIGYDPYITEEILEKRNVHVTLTDNLNNLFAQSDIVSLHMPGPADNKPIIGREELARMKKGVFLINTARGSLIDEQALCNALHDGVIAGVGLDVFQSEPPLPDNPLYKFDNVIVTPHSAALTVEGNRNMAVRVAENLCTVLDNRLTKDLANPDIWDQRRM